MADEWGVKIAFQFRWGNEPDRKFKSRIVTGELLGGGFSAEFQRTAAAQFEIASGQPHAARRLHSAKRFADSRKLQTCLGGVQ